MDFPTHLSGIAALYPIYAVQEWVFHGDDIRTRLVEFAIHIKSPSVLEVADITMRTASELGADKAAIVKQVVNRLGGKISAKYAEYMYLYLLYEGVLHALDN